MTSTMKAAVVDAFGEPLILREWDLPSLLSGEPQSSPPWHSMPGGAVEQLSSQVWSALQYHCSAPLLMHEPEQCLCGTPTGSEKDSGGSLRACEGPAVADEMIMAKAMTV